MKWCNTKEVVVQYILLVHIPLMFGMNIPNHSWHMDPSHKVYIPESDLQSLTLHYECLSILVPKLNNLVEYHSHTMLQTVLK